MSIANSNEQIANCKLHLKMIQSIFDMILYDDLRTTVNGSDIMKKIQQEKKVKVNAK